jgi:hypothetical protein
MKVHVQNIASESEYYKDKRDCLQVIFWPQMYIFKLVLSVEEIQQVKR